jgi:hypothetical protein
MLTETAREEGAQLGRHWASVLSLDSDLEGNLDGDLDIDLDRGLQRRGGLGAGQRPPPRAPQQVLFSVATGAIRERVEPVGPLSVAAGCGGRRRSWLQLRRGE